MSPAKKATSKKASSSKRAPAKKSAAKKTPPTPRRRRREPEKPDVDQVVEDLGKKGADSGPAKTPGDAGPVETSTRHELEQLRISRSALAASAVILARHVDHAESAPAASAAARELRMTLNTAKSVLLPHTHDDDEGGSNVTPPSRLEAMRKKAERRSGRSAK